jgi:hypothetical protein
VTREEREKKIAAICDAMDNWDLETLLQWAKDVRGDMLKNVGDDVIELEYQEDVVGS